jgi:hypothetical protein
MREERRLITPEERELWEEDHRLLTLERAIQVCRNGYPEDRADAKATVKEFGFDNPDKAWNYLWVERGKFNRRRKALPPN